MKWEQVCTAAADLKLASINGKVIGGPQRFGWHSHPFIEWGLVLEGECVWEVEAERYELTEGQMMLVPQGLVHREVVPDTARTRLTWIGFATRYGQQGTAAHDSLGRLLQLDGSMPYAELRDTRMFFENADSPAPRKIDAGALCPLRLELGRWQQDIRRLFLTIYDEQSESAYGSELRISLCLSELLLLTARAVQAQATGGDESAGAAGQDIPLRQIQLAHAASRFFDNNTEQGITVESVARYFRLTPQYFSTLFRKVHGQSPARYQQGARVRQACRLLSGSQRSIKEIAAQCGYADSAHFCRQFRTHERCSPTQYRLRKASAKA